jgi:probable rRNA maturation factor
VSAMHVDDPAQPEIAFSNRQAIAVDESALARLAADTLTAEGVADAEMSVSFVEPQEMAELHVRYMDEEGPTDVLSFPLDEYAGGRRVLGDVVICPQFARGNNADLDAEIRLLLVHGILHLLGYDHEEDEERAEMWARQERYSGVRA